MKGCREKFVCQDVHMSLSSGFASDMMSWSDTSCDTWQDGEGRECRLVFIDKEIKQNAANFKPNFLLHAAEEILRFKMNDQVQARVGGRQEMDGGRTPQEKSTANSRREKSTANSRREKSTANSSRRKKSTANSRREKSTANSRREKSTANSRRERAQPTAGEKRAQPTAGEKRTQPTAGEKRAQPTAGEKRAQPTAGEKRTQPTAGEKRAGASSIVTRDQRGSCEEAAVLKVV